jgi:hypothetical protein
VAPGGIEILQSGSRHRLAGKSDPDVAARLTNSRKHSVNQLSKAIWEFVKLELVKLGPPRGVGRVSRCCDLALWQPALSLSLAPTGLTAFLR